MRLLVEFEHWAHESRLISAGMDPVNPGAATRIIKGPSRSQNKHGDAARKSIVDGHGGVHETNVGMERNGHRPFRDLCVSMGDSYGVLLVKTGDHLGGRIATVVNNAIVDASIARARVESDIAKVKAGDLLCNGITAQANKVCVLCQACRLRELDVADIDTRLSCRHGHIGLLFSGLGSCDSETRLSRSVHGVLFLGLKEPEDTGGRFPAFLKRIDQPYMSLASVVCFRWTKATYASPIAVIPRDSHSRRLGSRNVAERLLIYQKSGREPRLTFRGPGSFSPQNGSRLQIHWICQTLF